MSKSVSPSVLSCDGTGIVPIIIIYCYIYIIPLVEVSKSVSPSVLSCDGTGIVPIIIAISVYNMYLQ